MRVARFFIALFITFHSIYGLDVVINYGKEAKEYFSVMNISHQSPLSCEEKKNAENVVLYVVCSIEQLPLASFSHTETIFFRFWSNVIDNRFYLYIEPKQKIKLFSTPNDLKGSQKITKEQATSSKTWQIIGYKDYIPFLNEEVKLKGINFPIKIIKNKQIFLDNLDIDRSPLHYEDSEDFFAYTQIKALMDNHSYIEAVKNIDETLNAYPHSIFTKDLLLFRIRALERFDSIENSDMIIDMGTKWVKKYTTDSAVPEVLYYLGNAYADIRIPNEAKYYFERVIREYPDSTYAPLSKMSLAKHFHSGADLKYATRLFTQSYTEAKDLDSAAAIAMEFARFYVEQNNATEAQKMLDSMLRANPSYITKYPVRHYEYLKFLNDSNMPLIAAKLGEYLYNNLRTQDIPKEDLLNDVSLWYQAANDVQNAHKINQLFLQEFENRPKTAEIKDRDDNLLFALASEASNKEKLEKYDYIIDSFPDTPQSTKAQSLKAQTLLEMGEYEKVLEMIEQKIPLDSKLVSKTYEALIDKSLESGNCKQASKFYLDYPQAHIAENKKSVAFDCLYSLSLNKQAQVISSGMAESAKDLPTKLAWLYKDALNFDKLGDSKQTSISGRDALQIAKNLKSKKHFDVGFVLFNALDLLNNKPEKLQVYDFLKQNLSDDIRMFEVNLSMLKDSEAQKEELGIELYAKDILRLQKIHNDDKHSPYVDFALIQSYIRTAKFDNALSVLDLLLNKDISDENKQKALYLKGSVLKSINKDSKSTFSQCVNINAESAWKNLCSQALSIIK